jgi:uncharacterized protein (DUF427 family)
MSQTITLKPARGKWVIRSGDGVLAESREAIELREGNRAPVLYFPRGDIGMAFLDRSGTTTTCPHKGTATYFHIVGASETLSDAAWSYEDPHQAVAGIKDHIAFYGAKVFVEKV